MPIWLTPPLSAVGVWLRDWIWLQGFHSLFFQLLLLASHKRQQSVQDWNAFMSLILFFCLTLQGAKRTLYHFKLLFLFSSLFNCICSRVKAPQNNNCTTPIPIAIPPQKKIPIAMPLSKSCSSVYTDQQFHATIYSLHKSLHLKCFIRIVLYVHSPHNLAKIYRN